MRRAGVDEAAIDGVLVQLRQHRLLDDTAFAQYWVEQRQTFRPRGARLLRAELARLGVPRGAARAAAASAAGSAEDDAYALAAKRARILRGLDRRTFESRLSGYLARRGYEWDTVIAVVERLWREREITSPGQYVIK